MDGNASFHKVSVTSKLIILQKVLCSENEKIWVLHDWREKENVKNNFLPSVRL